MLLALCSVLYSNLQSMGQHLLQDSPGGALTTPRCNTLTVCPSQRAAKMLRARSTASVEGLPMFTSVFAIPTNAMWNLGFPHQHQSQQQSPLQSPLRSPLLNQQPN